MTIRTSSTRAVAAALLACAVGAFIQAPVAHAAQVTGRVLNLSEEGGQALAGARVALRAIGDTAVAYVADTRSARDGSFRFRSVPESGDYVYVLETTFAGQRQPSDPFLLEGPAANVDLMVYDTTSSAESITIEKLHLIIAPEGDGLTVTSVNVVHNAGAIYLGSPPSTPGEPRIGLEFPLPKQAGDLQVIQGLLALHRVPTERGFASVIPFFPGTDTLVFSYHLPLHGSTHFELESPCRVTSLSVMALAADIELEVEGAEERPSPMGPQGPQLVNFERSMVSAGAPVRVVVSRIAGASATGHWLVLAAVAALVLVVAFAITQRRSRKRTADASTAAEARADAGDQSADDADALVAMVARLDEAYENDEIQEADYVAERRALKSRLMRALEEEEL